MTDKLTFLGPATSEAKSTEVIRLMLPKRGIVGFRHETIHTTMCTGNMFFPLLPSNFNGNSHEPLSDHTHSPFCVTPLSTY